MIQMSCAPETEVFEPVRIPSREDPAQGTGGGGFAVSRDWPGIPFSGAPVSLRGFRGVRYPLPFGSPRLEKMSQPPSYKADEETTINN